LPALKREKSIIVSGVDLRKGYAGEAEGAIVKRAFQLALGRGGKGVAKALNKDGLRTRTSEPRTRLH